ncbi:hypothetical protein SUGI_0623790 [Cryptomeria japonica]|uniref:protein SPA1-RELATED 4 n=1 Tax=Cryptomeria japonica TaxID=3369 RepID=UPI0024146BAE|nr:protein SPA1-RELATED 4 [Cryptomeria japonica]XP_057826679.2 protein SPA1-RELATED 4 [Cryptomeria japonica]XP_057826680.2 protein SPA1-RELATED 4 [Cryptomeria japonica]XP_057826681.2 protein SPA1-RELATED 4 [Cryptomeria japonica]XP_057826682.2 protein SPA1-RELATED 4 [Cryptomeria japonica]XP_057826683.2 protein SPA1-RELATED 4 [Cryptomeria japonica]GLJ31133.1 hypothetical protein SUGI_0623790 [Cryptomeria japonica]
MDGSQGLNREQSGQREFYYSGESSINNDMSKDASNTGCSQAEQEEKCAGRPCGNLDNKQHLCAFRTPTTTQPCMDDLEEDDISLREWLNMPNRSVNRLECLHIFKQILEIVSLAHSEGVVLQNIRPSCFMLSSFNRVSFIESASCTSSGSDSSDDSTGRLPRTLPGQTANYNLRQHGNNMGHISRAGREVDQTASVHMASHQTHARSISTRGDGCQELSLRDANTDVSRVSGRLTSTGDCSKKLDVVGGMRVIPHAMDSDAGEGTNQENMDAMNEDENVEERSNRFPLKQILLMEMKWYTTPEELSGGSISFSSDIYCLGVLFFELFCTFSSEAEQQAFMSNLRHRVLPPQLLCKWPKEASFCVWLLHPVAASRPKLSEVLQSEMISEAKEALEERQAAVKLKGKIADTELLLDFLLQLQKQKQERADKLSDVITCLTLDIEEVLRQQLILQHLAFDRNDKSPISKGKNSIDSSSQLDQISEPSFTNTGNIPTGKGTMLGKHLRQESKFHRASSRRKHGKSDVQIDREEELLSRSARLMKHFKKLEQVYFSTRCKAKQFIGHSAGKHSSTSSIGWEPVVGTDTCNVSSVDSLAGIARQGAGRMNDQLGSFFDSLCKYLRFSKFKVIANLQHGDLLNSSNLVCSLSFDRDKEFFATAGVNKKIKVFEYNTVLHENMDIHYPVVEMTSKSKFSNICWNSYIKNQMASSDFDGVVRLWDVSKSQSIMDFKEHGKRVWSVDFCQSDPTRLASGGDDGMVKLWNINQEKSIATIRTKANVCSVQFAPDSGRLIALGSADYKVYCYDLRNIRAPLCILASHNKTVSYVKFLDSGSLVSASTDNTIKLWDLATNKARVLGSPVNPVRTFTGHSNVKNFVGLSVSDGYIASGSETNEVFVYHKSLPMPVASYKFNSADPVTGLEMEDDDAQFVSCVCWRGQTQTLAAANSSGNIRLLEMV